VIGWSQVYGKTAKGHNEKAGVCARALFASHCVRVDIWSYGMVLFELLTLDIPYRYVMA
jgi:serine/threonine protein kinase